MAHRINWLEFGIGALIVVDPLNLIAPPLGVAADIAGLYIIGDSLGLDLKL